VPCIPLTNTTTTTNSYDNDNDNNTDTTYNDYHHIESTSTMAWNTCTIGDQVPSRGSWFSQFIGRLILFVLGWRIDVSGLPNIRKFVLVGAPHTSNWEFCMTVLMILALRMNINWMGKHTMFAWPFGPILRWLGGLPIDRRSKNDVTSGTIAEFKRRSHLCVAIMVEGTRERVPNWKTGFWYIARGANVPLVPVVFDYGRKLMRFGPAHITTDDLVHDTYELQCEFRDAIAKNPELQLELPVDPELTRQLVAREADRIKQKQAEQDAANNNDNDNENENENDNNDNDNESEDRIPPSTEGVEALPVSSL
jgi:1-acyl-sn-glycerol-3-phosphate acyltransferase